MTLFAFGHEVGMQGIMLETAGSVADLSEMAAEHGLDLNVTVLSTPQEAQAAPSYYGVFSLLWNGRLLSDHYVSKGRFRYILRDERQQESR